MEACMLPLPQVTELEELPPEFLADELWPGIGIRRSLPCGVHLSVAVLLRFRELMALEQWPVQLTRMCYDRLYAYERIAQAHASASQDLKSLALQLFQAYHRMDQAESGRRRPSLLS
jgi:hypothetical protein